MSGEHFYREQGLLSDPQGYASCLAALPQGVAALCGVVQGLLIHDYYGGKLYDAPPPDFVGASRATLPIPQRIEAILATEAAPLDQARPTQRRSVGTCRDFALLLCSALRQQGVAARVRCGFATYFTRPGYEDHWLCEYWSPADRRWHRADPQLDAAHRRHLAIDFDPADVPADRFLPAWQAWEIARQGDAEAERFGHGAARGAWFVQVNLARDLSALTKRETSSWDSWRAAGEGYVLDAKARRLADRLAAAAAAQGLEAPLLDAELETVIATPPWVKRPA
jgi:hypothetical protein